MLYPTLTPLNTSRELIDVFKGYNHNIRIGGGEFFEMTNLSSDNYPLLSPRPKRGVYESPEAPAGLIAKDALCYVDGADFVIGEQRVPMELTVDDAQKSLISMGAHVIIMPDKKYINTTAKEDGSFEYGDIEASVTTSESVSFALCKADGSSYGTDIPTQATAPTEPANLALWIDTSSVPHALKQYSASQKTWTSIATTCIKISSSGIGAPFSEGDGVTLSGIADTALADTLRSAIIQARGDGYIVVKGILDKVTTQTAALTVERKMPNMDFIIESENRLWGCRYGTALNGKIVNEIYASKLGDFKNWNCFAGIASDSYAVSIGTDGPFTGAVTLGRPLFFKENCMHAVYGNYPSNFQVQATSLRGVQKGCERSLAVVNEILYYKSRSGVCAYDGSLPVEISAALGDVAYHNAVAGALGNKYYISMSDSYGNFHLFVFDTSKGMWHREDGTQAECFCGFRGDLYFVDHATNQIKTVKGTGMTETVPIKWSAVTGIIGTDSPDKKYISRMDVRMQLEVGARVAFYAEYDSSGNYEYLFTMTGKSLQSFSVPFRTRRCDHLRLRIVGTGEAKLFSICKTIEGGSNR